MSYLRAMATSFRKGAGRKAGRNPYIQRVKTHDKREERASVARVLQAVNNANGKITFTKLNTDNLMS